MSSTNFQISELKVRASGLTREQAERLGQTVAERLAEIPLANSQSRNIPALTVRLGSAAPRSVEGLANEIVHQIRRSLG